MKKWTLQIETQRRRYRERQRASDGSTRPSGTSATEFTYLQNHATLENPYKEDDDDEDDVETPGSNQAYPVYPSNSEFSASRNGSSTSLRSRSTTGESGSVGSSRAGPPRFAAGSFSSSSQVPLSLRTQQLQAATTSPTREIGGDSYFSPTVESPVSARISGSSQTGMYPFPRQAVPQGGYYEDGHGHSRFTAPAIGAMGRAPITREQTAPPSNGYAPGRGILPKPSFPAGSGMHSAQQYSLAPRNRSASSPDIHAQRRIPTSAPPDIPVPTLPQQFAQNGYIPRSQSNSPSVLSGSPSRAGNSSPGLALNRERSRPAQSESYSYDNMAAQRQETRFMSHPSSRSITPVQHSNAALISRGQASPHNIQPLSPPPGPRAPLPTSMPFDPQQQQQQQPTQLKVKVHAPAANQILTLVVPLNISYQSLKDRIDAKLQRSTNLSLGDRGQGNQVKLKYKDEEDLVSIQNDEDVLTAFETWREQRGDGAAGMGEIELYCQR